MSWNTSRVIKNKIIQSYIIILQAYIPKRRTLIHVLLICIFFCIFFSSLEFGWVPKCNSQATLIMYFKTYFTEFIICPVIFCNTMFLQVFDPVCVIHASEWPPWWFEILPNRKEKQLFNDANRIKSTKTQHTLVERCGLEIEYR